MDIKTRLQEFVEGDLIHRIAPIDHALMKGDRSHIENPIRFLGIESNLFFWQWVHDFDDDIRISELAFWDDENWRIWPTNFIERLKEKWCIPINKDTK